MLALTLVAVGTSHAQVVAQSLGTRPDPLSQEVLRALQQQRGGQSLELGAQSNVQIQTPPVYPQALQVAPLNPQQYAPATSSDNSLSALERLMSLRVGRRVLQYGYDVFGRGNPIVVRQSGALQDNYVMGEGDEVLVTLHGQESASYRTRVDRDGRVVLPGLTPTAASGRSFGAFRADLERAVSRAFVGTDVSVSIGAVRQISVRVVGEVDVPGVYSLSGLSSALDALSLAGGVKKSGSLRDIQIVRGSQILQLDLYALLNRSIGSDVTLSEGDRIVVPLLDRSVTVVGRVKRPGIYEIAPGSGGIRADALLAMAGGPEIRGAYRFSVMRTLNDGRRETIQVGSQNDTLMLDGDVLFVDSSVDASVARIELMGATSAHGSFALNSTPTLQALFKSADMFTPQPGQPLPYLLIAAILRLDSQTMQRTVIPFSPIDSINGRNDMPLESNDVIFMLNVAEMRYVAERASETARREFERGNELASNTRRDNLLSSSAGRNAAGQALPVGMLQTGSVNGTGNVSTAVPNSAFPAAPQNRQPGPSGDRSFYPNQPTNDLDTRFDNRLPANEIDQGPYRAESNTALPQLSGIPAPRQSASDDDYDLPRDARPFERTSAKPNQSDEYGRDARMREPTLRLFIGLDDDARRLLVNTLSNYYVLVSGEVHNPGVFLAMPQVGLDNLVQAAGGVTPNVDLSSFDVSSSNVDNVSGISRTERKTFKMPVSQFSQVRLKPLDRVRFNKVFSDRIGEVAIHGEVRNPGAFEITRGERLSSVLMRAGGLTSDAYPYGAIFLRHSVADQQRGVLQREADALESQLVGLMGTKTATTGQISDAEIQYVNQLVTRLRQAESQAGRVAVQIDPVDIAVHPELDVTLEPGDRLYIPRKPNSVVVAGEVMSPGGIQYTNKLGVSDYIAKAGGTSEVANEGRIFVIQPDGSAVQAGDFWSGGSATLAPGSVIVVPRTLRPFTWDAFVQNAIQLTSQLAITAASISVIFQ